MSTVFFNNVKASSSKSKKGQISALEMFAAKPTTSKTEKNNIKKEEDVQGDTEEKVWKVAYNFWLLLKIAKLKKKHKWFFESLTR